MRESEHNEALVAIGDAIASFGRIKTVGAGASFIQTNKLQAVQDKVTKVLNKSKTLKTMYAPIIMSLATLATSADPEAVEKIINLMHKIKTALATSLKEDQDNEATEAADWVIEKATIENTISTLNSQIHTLKTDISKYELRIEEAKGIIAAQIKTRDEEIQLLADETIWCAEEDDLYSSSDADR